MKFEFGGPQRYAHQLAGLRRLIETRGVCALLMEPGLGKTATTLDYLSLLALKSEHIVNGAREARVLVISPKAAMDTWVLQTEEYLSPQVNVWAEVLGGSIPDKAATLISRGPNPYVPKAVRRMKDHKQLPHRGLNADRAELIYTRGDFGPRRGPSDIQSKEGKPRLVLLSTNFDTFASRARVGRGTMADVLVKAVSAFQPDVIVVDEMHKIKGYGSNTSRLIGRLGELVQRRIGLTGTVMPQGPMDVFGQWRFINPYAFGDLDPRTRERRKATLAGFERMYAIKGGYMGREVIAYKNLDHLQNIMAQNSIVVRKEDALDLPKMTDAVVPIVLSSKEQRAYDRMKKDLAASVGGSLISAPNRLTQMLRLRQITAGHLPDDTGQVQLVGESKVDAISSIVHDTLEGEKRLVVFALFRHEIEELRRKLAKPGTEVMVIDGNTPDDQRLALRRRFGSDAPERIVLVAQVQTISLSVNELVTASNAIFATLSQRRDELVQARDRLNRIGQTKPCTFWFVLARGTVDEVIFKSHQERTNLETAILQHVRGIEDSRNKEPAEDVTARIPE